MNNKPKNCVVKASDGVSIWQPGIKGNCVTIKVSPWNVEKSQHTVFLHDLPASGEIKEHAHENNEEIFICLEGEGIIAIDGQEFSFKKHDVAFLAPLSKHSIRAISDLKTIVIISPTGLEERFQLMGIWKKSTDEAPPESFDSEIGKNCSHGVLS